MEFRPGGMSSDEDSDYDGFVVQHPTNGPKKPRSYQIQLSKEDQFIEASKNLDEEKMVQFLSEGVDINFKPTNNWNAILHAANAGNKTILQFLISNGANVNSSHEKVTPLLALCDSSSSDELQLFECLELLLANGANPRDRDWFKVPAISKAVKRNHKNLVIRLLNEGCDVNSADSDGWTPLFYAVDTGNKELIDFLKDSGASLYSVDIKGRSILEFAATKDNKDIIEMLAGGKCVEEDNSYRVMTYKSSFDDMMAQLPNPKERLSGFPCEVYNLLTTIGLQCLIRDFQQQNINLGNFLTLSDSELRDLGVRFWFDRVRILFAIKQFLEFPWEITGFGMNITDKNIDAFKVTETLATILRQLTVLNFTIYNCSGGSHCKDNDTTKSMLKSCREIFRLLKLIKERAVFLDKSIKTVSCDLIKLEEEPPVKWKKILKISVSSGLILLPALIILKRLKF